MKSDIYVVMGVSGSGKSLIGSRLARALGIEFVEGDEFHSAENVARMSSGTPLTDEDRAGWLSALARRIRVANEAGSGVVISCSALKRVYRDILRDDYDNVQFVFLRGSPDVIAERISKRGDQHYMPASLLESQFAILEEPAEDERAWVFDVNDAPDTIVADLIARASQ